MSHRDTVLRRIDPATSKVTAKIDTGVLGCGDLVAGAGSIWVTGCGATPGLVRVDPRRARVQDSARTTGLGPAFHDGELWVGAPAAGGGEELRRAHPDRLDEARAVPVAGLIEANGVVSSGGSVWVSDKTSAVVYRVDPATSTVLAAIPIALDPNDGYLLEHDGDGDGGQHRGRRRIHPVHHG